MAKEIKAMNFTDGRMTQKDFISGNCEILENEVVIHGGLINGKYSPNKVRKFFVTQEIPVSQIPVVELPEKNFSDFHVKLGVWHEAIVKDKKFSIIKTKDGIYSVIQDTPSQPYFELGELIPEEYITSVIEQKWYKAVVLKS